MDAETDGQGIETYFKFSQFELPGSIKGFIRKYSTKALLLGAYMCLAFRLLHLSLTTLRREHKIEAQRGRFEWVSSEDRLGSGKDFGLIKHLSHEQKQHNRINSKIDTMRECIKDDA